jgi:CBS domain-containing protein
MEPAVTVFAACSVHEAASLLIETGSSLLAVVDDEEQLVGVVTQWDITRATADGVDPAGPITLIMTTQVVAASLMDSLVEVVRKLEHHEISVIPIVADKKVLGLVSTDLLTRRSLLPLLVKQKT